MPVSTIQAVFNAVNAEVVRFGVVPVENNQQGLVPETADCLATHDVHIAAELPMGRALHLREPHRSAF